MRGWRAGDGTGGNTRGVAANRPAQVSDARQRIAEGDPMRRASAAFLACDVEADGVPVILWTGRAGCDGIWGGEFRGVLSGCGAVRAIVGGGHAGSVADRGTVGS